MKMLGWGLTVVVLAGALSRADQPETTGGAVDAQGEAASPPLKTVYVSVKGTGPDRPSRAERLLMTEILTKSINQGSPLRAVGKVEEADVILTALLLPRSKAARPDGPVVVAMVPSGSISRTEALQVQELMTKAINEVSPHKVVGSTADADWILRVRFEPRTPPDR